MALQRCKLIFRRIIFRGLKSITVDDPQQHSLLRLISANISIYTPHTSLDACQDGINDWLARMAAGIDVTRANEDLAAEPIVPSKQSFAGQEKSGMGRLLRLDQPLTIDELVRRTKQVTKLKHGE